MFLPMGIGALLVHDGRRLRAAHAADAAYLHDMHAEGETPSFGDYSLELTRPFRGLRVWMALRLYGWLPFIEALDRCRDLALRLDRELRADDRFELAWTPALSTVTFRLRGGSNAATEAVLRRVNDAGRVLLSSTSVTRPGEGAPSFWIRACILSHRSGDADVDHALEDIRTAAAGVLATA
jgi:aromatic-L-amino-acid decarboxylase